MTQSSSVLLPFDPFLAIDRSYATCYRSEKVRNSTRVNIQMKQNKRNETEEGLELGPPDYNASGLNHSATFLITLSNMNTNGWETCMR